LPEGRVGWAVRREAVRIVAAHGIPATLLSRWPVRAGQRFVSVRVGDAILTATAEPGCDAAPGPCHIAIDPEAVQVWALGERV
jgi:hypothetical protein